MTLYFVLSLICAAPYENIPMVSKITFTSDLPPVKPSAIALGTVFNHAVSLVVMAPLFGETYRSAQEANTKEEFFKSKEAATAAATWGSSVVGSAIQSYGVGALINATGTLTYKGAAYLGTLIFMASAAPSVRITPFC
jgi:hypothetical protein